MIGPKTPCDICKQPLGDRHFSVNGETWHYYVCMHRHCAKEATKKLMQRDGVESFIDLVYHRPSLQPACVSSTHPAGCTHNAEHNGSMLVCSLYEAQRQEDAQ